MPKFLIIRFSSIGDIIQCMGIIDGIREQFSRCRNPLDRPKRYGLLSWPWNKRIGKIMGFR